MSIQIFRSTFPHATAQHFTVLCVFTVNQQQQQQKKRYDGKLFSEKKSTQKMKKKKRFCCFSHIFHTFSWKLLAAWQVPHFSLIPPSSSENNIYSIRPKRYKHTHAFTHTHTLNKKKLSIFFFYFSFYFFWGWCRFDIMK